MTSMNAHDIALLLLGIQTGWAAAFVTWAVINRPRLTVAEKAASKARAEAKEASK